MHRVMVTMENLYDILKCNPQASVEELRKSYTKLILQYHPDKSLSKEVDSTAAVQLSNCETNGLERSSASSGTPQQSDEFIRINKAWQILSDPGMRRQFDIKWQERCLAQDLPVQEEVQFTEFECLDGSDGFVYPCRCGSDFVLSNTEAELHYDIVCCATCSLTVKVLYDTSVS